MDVNDFKIKKSQWVLYILISAALLYITESWLMSLGIFLLIILADYLVADYVMRKRGNEDDESIS
mgnify:CR=1 FL=1